MCCSVCLCGALCKREGTPACAGSRERCLPVTCLWPAEGGACVAAGGARRALTLVRSAPAAPTPLRCSEGGRAHNSLRSLRSLRSDRCASQFTKRAGTRANRLPALLGAPQIAPAGHRLPRRHGGRQVEARTADHDAAKARMGAGRGACAPPRSAGQPGRARTRALQALTRSRCVSAVNEVNGASSAAGPAVRASQGTLAQRGQAPKLRPVPILAFASSANRSSK
jgi:hypothetical protein